MINLLKLSFNFSLFLTWFMFGIVIGILFWIWGDSMIPIYLLKIFSGISFLTVFWVFLMVVFAFIVFKAKKEKLKSLARGDIYNFSPIVINATFKAASVLFGLSIIGMLCWIVTDSHNALGSAFYGIIFLISFLYLWINLISISNEINVKA